MLERALAGGRAIKGRGRGQPPALSCCPPCRRRLRRQQVAGSPVAGPPRRHAAPQPTERDGPAPRASLAPWPLLPPAARPTCQSRLVQLCSASGASLGCTASSSLCFPTRRASCSPPPPGLLQGMLCPSAPRLPGGAHLPGLSVCRKNNHLSPCCQNIKETHDSCRQPPWLACPPADLLPGQPAAFIPGPGGLVALAVAMT